MASEYTVGKWGAYRVVNFYGNDVAGVVDFYQAENADGVSVLSKNIAPDSLEILQKFKGLKVILFHDTPQLVLNGLQGLPDLEEIMLCGTKQELDFNWVPGLRRLVCDWNAGVLKNTENSNLLSLSIEKYKSKTSDLSALPYFPRLQKLELLQSPIQSLAGINRFSELREIKLAYLNKLENLGKLDLPHLRTFIADKCKNLSDHERLGSCSAISELQLHECGTISSLQFIALLKDLKSFRFIKTDVLDGDLSPLQNLADVYFTEKPYFSAKVKDFKQQKKNWN